MTRKRLTLLALICLMTAACVHPQSAKQTSRAEIDGLMSRYAGEVPGASLLVVRDGRAIVRPTGMRTWKSTSRPVPRPTIAWHRLPSSSLRPASCC